MWIRFDLSQYPVLSNLISVKYWIPFGDRLCQKLLVFVLMCHIIQMVHSMMNLGLKMSHEGAARVRHFQPRIIIFDILINICNIEPSRDCSMELSTVTRAAFDNDECHVTAFWPISEAAISWSYDNSICFVKCISTCVVGPVFWAQCMLLQWFASCLAVVDCLCQPHAGRQTLR